MNKRAITAILYSHKRPPLPIWEQVELAIIAAIKEAEERGVTVELLPMTEWDLLDSDRFPRLGSPRPTKYVTGHHDGYCRILHGCENASNDRVAILEHDVLYPPSYFWKAAQLPVTDDQLPTGARFRYNQSVYRWTPDHGYFFMPNKGGGICNVTSNLVADRATLAEELRHRINNEPVVKWGEPGRYWSEYSGPKSQTEIWDCGEMVVDIRWGGNLTGDRQPPPNAQVWDRSETWGPHKLLKRKLGL